MAKPFPLLLDRDGTIIVDRHYLSDASQVELEMGAAEGLRAMITLGGIPVVVTNQSGVARGMFDEASIHAVHARLSALLEAEGVAIAGYYHCPHGPDDGCNCRKPGVGLALRAAEELGLDLAQAVVIGDKLSDIDLAAAIGASAILVTTGKGATAADTARARNIAVAKDLLEASHLLPTMQR